MFLVMTFLIPALPLHWEYQEYEPWVWVIKIWVIKISLSMAQLHILLASWSHNSDLQLLMLFIAHTAVVLSDDTFIWVCLNDYINCWVQTWLLFVLKHYTFFVIRKPFFCLSLNFLKGTLMQIWKSPYMIVFI